MTLFGNILYLSEAGPGQASSLERAVTMAQNNQAKLTVIDVAAPLTAGIGLPAAGAASEKMQAAMVDHRLQQLNALVEPYQEQLLIQTDVLVGNKRYIEVIRAILREQYDLLIKPVENPSFIQRLFGSDDMQLLRNCPCPLWLTQADGKAKYDNVLAAVDFDLHIPDDVDRELNWKILDQSSGLAISDFSALHVLHVWDGLAESSIRLWSDNPEQASTAYLNDIRSQHQTALADLSMQFKARIGEQAYTHLAPNLHLRQGAPATVIPQLAQQVHADLVVMGTVARTGIAGMLIGNTAEAVLEQLQCSVLVVKPPGFISPITLPQE